MIRRPPRSTPLYSSAASDVYKRQTHEDGPEPSDEPIKFEAVDDTAETSTSQDSQDSDDSDTEVNAAEDDEAGGFGLVPGLLVGLVVLLLVAAAVAFVIARGRR